MELNSLMEWEGKTVQQDRREFLKWWGKAGVAVGFGSMTGFSGQSTAQASRSGATYDLYNWEQIRNDYFTLPRGSAYMNNSTMGPTLKPVQDRMAETQAIFSQGCYLDRFMSEILPKLGTVREAFRKVVNGHTGSRPGQYIGSVDSVTEGMSLVANGITFNSGDTILTTDHEHAGGRTMWELQRDRYEAKLLQIPLLIEGESEGEWKESLLDRFEKQLKRNNVKVVSFSWVTTSTGHILPAKELCQLAQKYGAVSVIDAAQAFIVIPIDVVDIDCDFLIANGHKYLCGPIGSGFVAIHPRQLQDVSSFWPTVVDDAYYHPEDLSMHYPYRKSGLSAYTNIIPLLEALNFHDALGAKTISARLQQIGRWLRRGLSNYPGRFEVITPMLNDLSCVMTCFRCRKVDSESFYQALKSNSSFPIHVKHSTEGGADCVRVSPHFYNTPDELNLLADAICRIAGVNRNLWPDFPG